MSASFSIENERANELQRETLCPHPDTNLKNYAYTYTSCESKVDALSVFVSIRNETVPSTLFKVEGTYDGLVEKFVVSSR